MGFSHIGLALDKRAAVRDKRALAIVGNNRTDSIAAPTIAAATSGFINFARIAIWVITTMIVRDGTAEDSANGRNFAVSI